MTIYLDNGASSCPKPPEVIEAVDTCLRQYCANPGRGAHRTAVAAARLIFQAREKAASFLGVPNSADLIFTQNATDALNLAMYGLLEPGDHVVTSVVEHNAVLRPLQVLSGSGVDVTFVSADHTGRISPDEVLSSVRPQTRLAVLGHASNVTGAIQPIEQIAYLLRDKDVPLLVDGAQSAGYIAYDVGAVPISMLACTGHKSLMAPQGVGLLYIAPDIELHSVRQGGTGTRSDEPQDELGRPDRYEAGTHNTPGIAGLGAAIDYIQEAGLETLSAHKDVLTAMMMIGLGDNEAVTVYGPPAGDPRAPLVSFNIAGMAPSEVAARLDRDYNIASRAGLHCAPGAHQAIGTRESGTVRVSIGPYNSASDIEMLLTAVAKIASGE